MVFRVVKLGFQGSKTWFRVVKMSFQVGKIGFSGWYNWVFSESGFSG